MIYLFLPRIARLWQLPLSISVSCVTISASWVPDSEWISTLINTYLAEELNLNPTVLPQYIQLASKYGLPSYASSSSLSSDPELSSLEPTSATKSILRFNEKACMIDSRDFGIYDSLWHPSTIEDGL